MEIPEHYKLVYTREQLAEGVSQVAEKVNDWVQLVSNPSSEPLLAVCVLRGAVFFYADLCREIKTAVDPVFCRAESITDPNNPTAGKGVRVSVEDIGAEGRHILIVDYICDTGLTLLKLHNIFLNLGAKSVRSAVLVHRDVNDSKYEPTWSAFTYQGNEWFVGCGLDDGGRNRNLPDVYVIDPPTEG